MIVPRAKTRLWICRKLDSSYTCGVARSKQITFRFLNLLHVRHHLQTRLFNVATLLVIFCPKVGYMNGENDRIVSQF